MIYDGIFVRRQGPSNREMMDALERSLAQLGMHSASDSYQRGVRRAAELEPLKPMPVQPPPRSSTRARVPGLDIRRFIPRRV